VKKNKPKRIKLLLVDDHPIVLEGIKSHLSAQDDFEVVGDAADGKEAIRQARRHLPDIILMDISMPHMNGLEAMTLLRTQAPNAKILVLTMHDKKEYISQIFRLGARGYLLKDTSPAELVHAIKLVHAGELVFSSTVSRILVDEFVSEGAKELKPRRPSELSEREREVLLLIAEGHSNKEIADRLSVGVRTIETHREHLMRKLNIHTVAGLTRYAIASGMITIE
jgi:two-component system, NarL family, nitrate/nitrite response regulator NarL